MAGVEPEEAKRIGIYIPEKVNEDTVPDGAQGDNGLGDVKFEYAKGYEKSSQKAEDVLIDTVKQNPGKISIVATGPLTNIASAIDKDPDFVKNVGELVIMGGDEGGGNIKPYAEFNIYQDPEAAKKVFEAGFEKITMIGFNVSKRITLCPEVESFLKENGELGDFIYRITRRTANVDRDKNKVDGPSMNDILTLLYLLEEGKMFETKKAVVDVDIKGETRGKTNILEPEAGKAVCNVLTGADGTAIIREMLTVLFPEKLEEIEDVLERRAFRIWSRDYIIGELENEKAKKVGEPETIERLDKTIKAVSYMWNREGGEKIMEEMVKVIGDIKSRRTNQPEQPPKDDGYEH
jgi:purine nucleosidase